MALSRLTLRLDDPHDGGASVILLPEGARSWYVRTDAARARYRRELGRHPALGRVPAAGARATSSWTPRVGPSPERATRRVRYRSAREPTTASRAEPPRRGRAAAGGAARRRARRPRWPGSAPRGDRRRARTARRAAAAGRGGASDAFGARWSRATPAAGASRGRVSDARSSCHARRLLVPGPPRAPALRPPSRVPGLPRGGLVLRGDHRDLRPARARAGRAARGRRRLPAHDDAVAAAALDDERRAAGRRATTATSTGWSSSPSARSSARAREDARFHGRSPASTRTSSSGVRRVFRETLRLGPRARVPQAPRRGQARDHHLRRHARLPAAHGHGAARRCARRSRSAAQHYRAHARARPAGHLAARVRLHAGARGASCARRASASASSTRTASPTPTRGRATACSRRSCRPAASSSSAATCESSRQVWSAEVGLPGRLRLPRVLPGHRLGAAARLPGRRPARRPAQERRHQVLPRHRQGGPGATSSPTTASGRWRRPRDHAGHFLREPPAAGRSARAGAWTGRRWW